MACAFLFTEQLTPLSVRRPANNGQGIGSRLMELLTEKYRKHHYIILLSETEQTIPFYQRYGFQVLKTSSPKGVKQSNGGC